MFKTLKQLLGIKTKECSRLDLLEEIQEWLTIEAIGAEEKLQKGLIGDEMKLLGFNEAFYLFEDLIQEKIDAERGKK